MKPKHSGRSKASAERAVKDRRTATGNHFFAGDKITLDKLGVARWSF